MEQKLVREKECADAISVSVRTLRYWRRRRIIPFFKVGALVMYSLDDVLQALKTYKRDSINLRPVAVPSPDTKSASHPVQHIRAKPDKTQKQPAGAKVE
jgi:hypothetical protein